jgi:hypothetical protein
MNNFMQAFVDKRPKRDQKLLMGDFNAKVGINNTDRELIMGNTWNRGTEQKCQALS